MAYCDAALGRFGVAQFPDNDQFSNFEVGGREEWLLFVAPKLNPLSSSSPSSSSSLPAPSPSFPTAAASSSATLKALLVQLGARECLMCSDKGNADYAKLSHIVDRASILLTNRKKSDFTTGDLVQDLDRLLKLPPGGSSATFPEMDMGVAMEALAAVVRYLELLSNEDNFAQFTLARFDSTQVHF